MSRCNRCLRKCNAERSKAEGFCGMTQNPVVSRAALHFWEESCISGTKGSGTVFFAGCNLQCVFCQNYGIAHVNLRDKDGRKRIPECVGKIVRTEELAAIF